jgi:hypothetical protein
MEENTMKFFFLTSGSFITRRFGNGSSFPSKSCLAHSRPRPVGQYGKTFLNFGAHDAISFIYRTLPVFRIELDCYSQNNHARR